MIAIFLKWFVAVCICFVLQTTLVGFISIGDIQPDLLMIIIFLLALRKGVMPGIYGGFFLGLGQDLYSPALLGQQALAKTVVGFFISLFNEKMMRTDPVVRIILLVISFLIHDTLFGMASLINTGEPLLSILPSLATQTLPRAVYSASLTALIFLWDHLVQPSLRR